MLKTNKKVIIRRILKKKSIIFLFLFIIDLLGRVNNTVKNILNKKRIGVINLPNGQNVGNILVKYAMFKKLEELGFNATIITPRLGWNRKVDLSFINRTINSHLLTLRASFSELNKNDYDYLILNSDQTWAYFDKKYFFDIAFFKFAKNWKIKKFIYSTSIGGEKWPFKRKEEKIAKKLLKKFSGISFREKGLINLVEKHLNIKGEYVLDPTLLIDKEYYLNEIINYKSNLNSSENFIFIYQLNNDKNLERIIQESKKKFNYKIFNYQLNRSDYIESFIYGIKNCKAVITDSFHGTIFSIIFNKPFIAFINTEIGKDRFNTLKEVFNLKNRIVDSLKNAFVNIDILLEPLYINKTLLDELKTFSINYIKKNLDLL